MNVNNAGIQPSKEISGDVKVSVIVAAFNHEKFISRCLRSLFNQTFYHRDYEILVIDDGSTDRTKFILDLFSKPDDEFLRIFGNEKNLGLPATLNKALALAKGKFIVRVDSDDFVNQNFISFLYSYLTLNETSDAVACDYLMVDDNEDTISRCDCFQNPIACGVMFQKQHLFDIGLYDSELRCHEERDLRIRFEENYSVDRLHVPLYRYRRHDDNMTNCSTLTEYYDHRLNEKHSKPL